MAPCQRCRAFASTGTRIPLRSFGFTANCLTEPTLNRPVSSKSDSAHFSRARLAAKARAALTQVEGAAEVRVVPGARERKLDFAIDRQKCARWGVSVADVEIALKHAASGQVVTHMIEGEKTYDVALRWPEKR